MPIHSKQEQPMSTNFYIIDQINPHTGEFDEHKLVKGVNLDIVDAALVYLSNYEPNWQGLGAISEATPLRLCCPMEF